MSLVGGAFPEEKRREYAVRQLTAGRVLYLTCDFTKPPKDKFVVVAVADDPPLLLVINSKISPFVNARPYLLNVQVTLGAAEHEFLKHDSYLDCGQVIESMGLEEIIRQLVGDLSRIKGELSIAAQAQVAGAVRRARTVSALHKRRICTVLK
jgi:hypothetical protein